MENYNQIPIGKYVGWGIVGLVILILVFGSFGTIGAGNVGIKTRFSNVVGTVQPGLYFKLPLIEGVTSMDVQTQKEQTEADASSADIQKVSAVIAVNYNIVPEKAADLYVRVGTDFGAKVIDPAIQEVVKATTAKYTAVELITKRPQVTDDIQSALSEKLALNDIKVTQVSVVNFDFSPQFNQAIEAKVTAEQNALAAKNKLDQVQYEAQQTVATAKAQAEAIQIQAQAINSQGGADYVALQAINKWKGDGCTSYCFGAGTQTPVPFFNLNK